VSNFSFALIVFALLGSLCASLIAVRIAVRQRELPGQRLRSIESGLNVVAEKQTEFALTLEQLANKVKMMRVRSAINHQSDPPTAEENGKDALRRRAGLIAGQPARHQ